MMTMPDTQGAGMPGSGVESDPSETGGARGQIRQVKEKVVDQAKTTFRDARDKASSSLADSRRQAADQVGGIASALHSAGQHLRGEQQERIAGLADGFADQVDQVAGYLRDADLQRLARDVEGLARRQPALVFGAAFAIGLLGARFLKSSEDRGKRFDRFEDEEEYGGYESIRAGGQAAGLGYDRPDDLGYTRPDDLGYDRSDDIPSTPRSTMGGSNAGA
jgi:hypothetical protein